MEIVIAVTRRCQHCSALQRELDALGLHYEVRYMEEHPEWVARFGLKGSPNIIVDGELVFRKMPELAELRAFFGNAGSR